MPAILRKELTDYFSSKRVLVLMLVMVAISVLTLYGAYSVVKDSPGQFQFYQLFTSPTSLKVPQQLSSYLVYPNMLTYIFIPILGILLGFDAVSRERSSRTLSRLMFQPIYRDNIINAKFLAGLFVMITAVATSLLLILGYGIRMIGVPPSSSELLRLFFFAVNTIVYGAFWMSLAMLLSTLFKRAYISLTIPVVIQVILGAYVYLLPRYLSSQSMSLTLMRISPTEWFTESSMVLLVPQWRGMGLVTASQETTYYMTYNPLSIGQSLAIVWPQLISLLAIAIVCFAVTYVLFIRKAVR